MGFFGVAIGVFAGLKLAHNLNPVADFLEDKFGIAVFPSDIYYFDEIPAIVNSHDVITVVIFALLVSLIAGGYPAFSAARLKPVEALRYE